ncbi:hypothetical protein [Embleya sp. NBC_00896]|uniref:hypothetical protein n=1 Tax=Embleya sp. NBC_00896 TaxID=2975961 RepID=UPI003865EB53|nr:hypothetical protein OG928_08565 [Embleya sp. NBC_00896]
MSELPVGPKRSDRRSRPAAAHEDDPQEEPQEEPPPPPHEDELPQDELLQDEPLLAHDEPPPQDEPPELDEWFQCEPCPYRNGSKPPPDRSKARRTRLRIAHGINTINAITRTTGIRKSHAMVLTSPIE